MSYDARESAAIGGQPVELYRWQQSGYYYRCTSAETTQAGDDGDYEPTPIERGNLVQGDEITRAALEVTLPGDHPVAQLFALGPPVDRVLLTLWRRHLGDTESLLAWQGRVLSCEWQRSKAVLHHEPDWTAIRRTGLRRTWGLQCPHVLYDAQCRALPVTVDGSVHAIDSVSVTVNAAAGYADGFFAGGMLHRADPLTGLTHRGMIVGHVGAVLTIHYPLPLAIGDGVVLTAGCDHTLATCTAKFANQANYGGFPNTPQNSPYGGTVLY